jgi:hypothetical protein
MSSYVLRATAQYKEPEKPGLRKPLLMEEAPTLAPLFFPILIIHIGTIRSTDFAHHVHTLTHSKKGTKV